MSPSTALTLFLAVGLAPVPIPKPKTVILFEKEADYRAATEIESVHEGVLRFRDGYRLDRGNVAKGEVILDLHLPKPVETLRAHVGKRVAITGKIVRRGGDGRFRDYLWPARLRVLPSKKNEDRALSGILARCSWSPPRKKAFGKKTYIFRSGEQVAEALQIRGKTAGDSASAILAKRLGVPHIDWRKQMVVCYSAGLLGQQSDQLHIHRVVVEKNTMKILYTLKDRLAPGDMSPLILTSPAQTILVRAHSGIVTFERAKPE